jgi:uncharacterized protein HemX
MIWVMLALIVVSLLAIFGALAFLGLTVYRFYKNVRALQNEVLPLVEDIVAKQERALELADRITTNQARLADQMERTNQAVDRLNYLVGQVSKAKEKLTTFNFLSPL